MNNTTLAIIPARGGSKGIPRKNVRLLAGKPLIAHTIEHAHHSHSVGRVVVSTDDPEIATVSQHYGAEVIWRPADISGDTATSESALLHALDHLRDTEGYEPDLVVFLQGTSPIRQPGAIDGAVQTLLDEEADSLFSASPLHGFVWRNHNNQLSSLTYDHRSRQRRQDAPEDVLENGSIYIFKPHILRAASNRLGGKIAVYRMPIVDSFQVDEPSDLTLMETLLAAYPSSPEIPSPEAVRLLVLDFDGVLTDNRVLVDQDGREAVWCHRGDGWGIAQLKQAGFVVMVLSTEQNPVVAARCRKLDIPYMHGVDDKLSRLQATVQQYALQPQQVAYVGNDVNDLACMQWVGIPIAVADAVPAVRATARWVTTTPGGYGAVREVTEWLLKEEIS